MQVVQFVGLGAPQRQRDVTPDVRFLKDVIEELKAAPAEEVIEPGLTATTSIHVPEVEGEPFGKFPIEWDTEDVQLYQSARNNVISAIQAAIGQTDVKRLLMAANALPQPDPTLVDVPRMITNLENLIAVYESKVLRVKKTPVLAIVAGIGLAVAGLGAITWASMRRKKRRRRR